MIIVSVIPMANPLIKLALCASIMVLASCQSQKHGELEKGPATSVETIDRLLRDLRPSLKPTTNVGMDAGLVKTDGRTKGISSFASPFTDPSIPNAMAWINRESMAFSRSWYKASGSASEVANEVVRYAGKPTYRRTYTRYKQNHTELIYTTDAEYSSTEAKVGCISNNLDASVMCINTSVSDCRPSSSRRRGRSISFDMVDEGYPFFKRTKMDVIFTEDGLLEEKEGHRRKCDGGVDS